MLLHQYCIKQLVYYTKTTPLLCWDQIKRFGDAQLQSRHKERMSNAGIKEGWSHWSLGHAAGLLAYLLEREERGFIPFILSSDAAINMFSLSQCP